MTLFTAIVWFVFVYTQAVEVQGRAICNSLPQITDGSYHITPESSECSERYGYETSCTVRVVCDDGYRLHGIILYVYCEYTGMERGYQWSEIPTCEAKALCDDGKKPGKVKNGVVDVTAGILASNNRFTVGTRLETTCNRGHNRYGTSVRSCLPNGEWTAGKPRCIPVLCDPLQNVSITNGWSDAQNRTYYKGDQIRFYCKRGYRTAGKSWRVCYEDSNGETGWTDDTPTCEVIRCPGIGVFENGDAFISKETRTPGTTISLRCYARYELIGPEQVECQPDGRWSAISACDRQNTENPGCGNPGIPYSGRKTGTNYDANEIVRFSCNMGYTLIGSSERTCLCSNGDTCTWGGEQPICRGPHEFDDPDDVMKRFEHITSSIANDTNVDLGASGKTIDVNYDGGWNIYFVFDASNSVGEENFLRGLQFAKALVSKVGVGKAQYGGVVYATNPVRFLRSWNYEEPTVPVVQKALDDVVRITEERNIPYGLGGGTGTRRALEKVLREVIPLTPFRDNAKNAVFLITDGKSNEGGSPIQVAEALKRDHDVLFHCIGVGDDVDNAELAHLASKPHSEHLFMMEYYEDMLSLPYAVTNQKEELCSTGWEVRSREQVNSGNCTMVSPDNPFTCNGSLAVWHYRSKYNRPFKAIVWRPVADISSSFQRYQIVGINDIPAGKTDENVDYVVPKCDRIKVTAGDVIGWSFPSEERWAALQYSSSNGATRIFQVDGDRYYSLQNGDVHDTSFGGTRLEYSIRAIVKTCSGNTASHWSVSGMQCCELRPDLREMCYNNDIHREQRANSSSIHPDVADYDEVVKYVGATEKNTLKIINTLVDTLPGQLVHARMRTVSHRVLYPPDRQRQVMLIFTTGAVDTSLALDNAKEYYLQHSNYTNINVFVYNASMETPENVVNLESSTVWAPPGWAPMKNVSSLKYVYEEIQLMLYSDPIHGINTSQIASVVKYIPIQSLYSISLEGKNEIQLPEFIYELKDKDIHTVVADMREGRQPKVATIDNLGEIQRYTIPDSEVRGNYENRVILQFERDPTVDKAAQDLFSKHSESSTLLWHDGRRAFKYNPERGTYEVLGPHDATRLTARDKLEIVGHGEQRKINGKIETTLSDLTARQLSERVQAIPGLRLNEAIGRVSLVSCKLSPDIGDGKFDMTFPVEFQKEFSKTVKSEVTTRVDDLIVNPYGQKRNFRDTSRKADKFVVDSEGKIDFVAGTRVSETSVLSGSGPLGPNDNTIIKRITENIIGSTIPENLANKITATWRESITFDTKSFSVFDIGDTGKSVEIFQPKIKDLSSIEIKQFVNGDAAINEVLSLATLLPDQHKRSIINKKVHPKKGNPKENAFIYAIGDFVYLMNPINFYVTKIGYVRFDIDPEFGVNADNVDEINNKVREAIQPDPNVQGRRTGEGYRGLVANTEMAESLMPKIFSILYGLEKGTFNVNEALRRTIRLRNTGGQVDMAAVDSATILEMAQLGTMTFSIGVSECVRNYETLAINMMIAETKIFSFQLHPMTKGDTWGRPDNPKRKDTGYNELIGENVRAEETQVLRDWSEHLSSSNIEIVESKIFQIKIAIVKKENLMNEINELRSSDQLPGGSDQNVNIQEADQIHTSYEIQDAVMKDHKEIAEKIEQQFKESFPGREFKDFEITITPRTDKTVVVDVVDKQNESIRKTLEIMPEELSGYTEEKFNEVNEHLGREQPGLQSPRQSDTLNKAMGIYGIAMGLQGGVRALQEGDLEHGLVGLGQFGHGVGALTGFNEKVSGKIFQNIQKSIDKGVVSLAEKTAEICLASEAKSVLKATGKLARFGECVPFVGIGFGVYMITEDIKHAVQATSPEELAHFITDAVLDVAITGLDVVGSAFPVALVVTEPLVIALNIARIFIDDIWNDITEELKKVQCPQHGTCFWKKLGATLLGFLKGVLDVVQGFASIFYYSPHKELQHTKEFKRQMADYHQYYSEVHKDGEPDSINFASGHESVWGGDIHFILHNDNTAQFCYNVDGVNNCHTIFTESNSIVLGIGESQHIKYKTVTEKVFLFIPVGHVKVMDGLQGISSSLTGYYEGNDDDNIFFAIQELPADANLDYSLSKYFYRLHGNGGDDVFHLGPQRSNVIGGNGADTYIIQKTGGHTVINNFAYDEETDLLVFEAPFASLFSRIDASGDLILSFLDTHSVVIQNWLQGKRYQHINLMAQPGVLFNVSQIVPLEPQLIAEAIYLTHEDHSHSIDLSIPMYAKVSSIIGSQYADSITGNKQDNMMNGGPGEDVVIGGDGQDHYVVKEGEGCDTINNKASDLVNDMLYMDIHIDRLQARVQGTDLRLYDASSSRTCVILKKWFTGEEYQHLTLTITDFILVKISPNRDCYNNRSCEPLLAFEINEMAATSGQTINASLPHLSHVTTIQGSPYQDRIYGNENTNFISGGTGRDLLAGLGGVDYYIIKVDEGDKVINNVASDLLVDTVMFPNRFDEIDLSIYDNSLIIYSRQVRVTVVKWFRGARYQHLYVKTTDGYMFSFIERNGWVVKTVLSIDKSKVSAPVFLDTSHTYNQSVSVTPPSLIFQVLHERMDDLETISSSDASNCDFSSTVEIYGSPTYSLVVGNGLNNLIHAEVGGGYYKGGNGSDTYTIEADDTIKIVNNFAEDKAQDIIKIKGEYSSLTLSDRTLLANDVVIDGMWNNTKLTLILENYKASTLNRHLHFQTPEGEIFNINSGTGTELSYEPDYNRTDDGCNKLWYKNPLMIDLSDRSSEQRVTLVDFPNDEAFYGVHGSQTASNHINGNRLDNNLIGGPLLDVIVGGNGNDVLKGLAGDDVLDGGGGDDILFGGNDDDWLLGGLGNDVIIPGYGTDMVNGESGYDTVMYMGDPWQGTGVMVNLALTMGLFADAEDDILENIENVYATSYNDILIGNDESNLLKSFDGDDILFSLGGNDVLQGGNGSDYYVFDLATGYKEVDNCADDKKIDVIMIRKREATIYYNATQDDLIITITSSYEQSEMPLTIKLLQFTANNEICGHLFFQTNSSLLTFQEFQLEAEGEPLDVSDYSISDYSSS